MCKTNYPELEKLVEALDHIEGKNEIAASKRIRALQEIEKKLITDYKIVIGDIVVEPLLVEAYYYHTEKFPDSSVHAANNSNAPTYKLARERQKNNFGKLYVHYGTKDGIDIVLSLSDNYYLSFLIKNALVNGEWKSQRAISKAICECCDCHGTCKGYNCKHYEEPVLTRTEPKNFEIAFAQRKGLHNDFAGYCLAALPIDIIRKYPFTAGESCTNIVKRFVKEMLAKGDIDKIKMQKMKELAHNLFTWDDKGK